MINQRFPHKKGLPFHVMLIPPGWRKQGFIVVKALSVIPNIGNVNITCDLSAIMNIYSRAFWPSMVHFHHFSVRNQSHSASSWVNFPQNAKAIAFPFV